jgi:ribonucleoside-diphosphate reductase alpha chain
MKTLSNESETGIEVENSSQTKRDRFFKRMEQMFEHKSKLSSMVDAEKISAYKETYFYLFEKIQNGELPSHSDYLGGNVLAKTIYERKYYVKDLENEAIEEKPEDVYMRLSAYMACIEEAKEKREQYAEKFYKDLYEGFYLPGGRVIAGAGDLFRLKTLANCFVSLIESDSLEGIYKSAYEAARTYSFGGGIGIDISHLRPKDSRVHNAADNSTGAVSFMELYSLTTGLIGQSGRRGALMLTLDVKHPDVLDFIQVKKEPNWVTNQILERMKMVEDISEGQTEEIKRHIIENTQVRFANISIKVSDEFMSAVEEQNLYGRDTILVYKKKAGGPVQGKSSDDQNYAYGISDKELSDYELLDKFSNVEELNAFLLEKKFNQITKEQLDDVKKRDFYGDFVLETDSQDYDLAVHYSGDFTTYYQSRSVGELKQLYKARDIWNLFVEGNYKTAEPGLLFWSQMTKYSPSNYVGRPISCTNPCGEVPLEQGGACNLGSVNLSRMVTNGYSSEAEVDWTLLDQTTENLTRFLDNVVWWNETLNALESQRDAAKITRRLGLGVMGIADMFNQLGMDYDGDDAMELLEKVMHRIAQVAYRTSALLAKEKGPAPCYEKEAYVKNPFFKEILDEDVKALVEEHGVRNVAILSIAPTGTISNAICGFKTKDKNYIGISGGIEPIFSLYYTRRSEQMQDGGIFKVFHSIAQAYIDVKGLNDRVQEAEGEDGLRELLPEHFFRTAHHIKAEMRVKVQGIAQKYVDHSISSTVNLPEDIDPEVISDIYLKAWRNGLKGITIYRDGSRYPILSVEGKETEFQRFKKKKFTMTVGEEKKVVDGNEILVMPSGKLTTIYHGKETGLF